MVNTSMTHVFRHPKFYRIPRDKSDQAISPEAATAAVGVRPGPGQNSKHQASSSEGSSEDLRSSKPQAPSIKLSNQPEQASSRKLQAPSYKRQA